MTGIVDLHTHLLPGVDDGVRDFGEALEELREAARQGVAAVVCTPHVRPERGPDRGKILSEHRRIHEQLVAAALEEGGLPRVGLGSEVLVLGDEIRLDDPTLRINGTSYALLEVLFWLEDFRGVRDLFRAALDAGWRPILAHVERYTYLERQDELLSLWREDGVLAQVNASSVAGEHGPEVRDRALRLLDERRVDLVASDVHGPHMRRNYTADAYALVSARRGEREARRLFRDVPAAVFAGAEVPPTADVAGA